MRLLKRSLPFAADTVDCSEVDLDRLEDMRIVRQFSASRSAVFSRTAFKVIVWPLKGAGEEAYRGAWGGGVRRSWR